MTFFCNKLLQKTGINVVFSRIFFKFGLLYCVNCGSLAEFYAVWRDYYGKTIDGGKNVVD